MPQVSEHAKHEKDNRQLGQEQRSACCSQYTASLYDDADVLRKRLCDDTRALRDNTECFRVDSWLDK